MKLLISSRKITFWLFVIVVALNAIGFVGRTVEYLMGIEETTELVRLFHVAEEGNVTAWYSSLLLLLSSLLLAITAFAKKTAQDPYLRHWKVLSVIFFYLSLDEAARIHEISIGPLRSLFNASGVFHYAWVIFAIPFVIFIMIYYSRFLFDLPQKTRNLFIAAGAIYIVGVLGAEMVGGYLMSHKIEFWNVRPILVTIEEFLENVGIVIFISALLSYLKSHLQDTEIALRFD